METVKCKFCGKENAPRAYFCTSCGKFIFAEGFETLGISNMAEMKMHRIVSNLKENPHTEILWNDTVDAWVKKVERIQSLSRIKDAGINTDDLTDKIDRFLKRCRKPDFEIAFVGAVKAGKSTLINALLGKDYASTDTNPETAALTKFRSSEQDYIHVKFYSQEEWNELWNSVQNDADEFMKLYSSLRAEQQKKTWIGHEDKYIELNNSDIANELKEWSSSQSAKHFFVKEIEVGISSLPKDFPKQVVFVDTPGLFDPVEFRSQISKNYIRSANAVLVCVKTLDLHGEEVKTVESVFSFSGHKREKVFIIATNWDKLNNTIIDWEKRYTYMSDSFTGKAFFPTEEMARNNILYTDAYHYSLCKNNNALGKNEKKQLALLTMKLQNDMEAAGEMRKRVPNCFKWLVEYEFGPLSSTEIQSLMEITNIRAVNKKITDELVSQYSKLMYRDIEVLYNDILHMVKRIAGERQKTINERLTISYADRKKIEDQVAQVEKNQRDVQKAQEQLVMVLRSLEKSKKKQLDVLLHKLDELEK